ncbi:MAG: transporter substrate-binding domain-containing protein [Deltaproteobacteria bacterium]|nr:transporter substrate-binding domain-containing protein [Candidatus Zymogenaceae bacterium]
MKRIRPWLFVFFLFLFAPLCPAQDTEHPITIGWVMDSRGMGDGGYNDAVSTVLAEMARNTRLTIVRVPRLELYPDKTVGDLLALGADIVISTDEGGMSGALVEAARANPDVQFILIGAEGAPLNNLASVIFEEDEAGYLAGYIAGTITRTNKIAFVGGAPFDPIKRFEYGFAGGVKDARRDAETIVSYVAEEGDANGLYDRDKTKEAVMRLAKKGADTVFIVSGTGTLGGVSTAEKMKMSIIGLGNDERKLSPKYVAASVIYRYDTAVKKILDDAVSGKAVGGVYLMSFTNGGLDLSGFSTSVDGAQRQKIAERKSLLTSGKITVPDYLSERRKTKLVVSLNVKTPPYEYIDEDGILVGYVIDVMNEMGRRLGREIVFNSFSGARIPSGLAATRSDIEPMVMIDEERTASFLVGEPWGIEESVLVVKKNDLVPREIFELISKKVGVVSGSVEEVYVRKLPGLFSKGYSSTEICLRALNRGEVDAAIVDKNAADFLLSDMLDDRDFVMTEKPMVISPYSAAMPRPGDPAYLKGIDNVLKSMKDDGTLKKFSRRWFE